MKNLSVLLWIASSILALGLLFARAIYPEYLWLTIVLGVALVGSLAALFQQNRKALKSRTVAYGVNSLVTVLLAVAILGVLNFLAVRYPYKLDLTKNKIHTFSDQSEKLMKGLQKTVKATLYAKLNQREQFRPLLENYKSLSPKFEIEYVDPDRETTRAKQAGIKKYGTLILTVGARDNKLEDISEEKITNALIKLLKEKSATLCTITGHGEKNFAGIDADGYDAVKKALGNQAYEVKDFNLIQDAKDGKVPDTCDSIAIIGPTKAFSPPEVKVFQEYLANGGRAVLALDVNLKGADYAPELDPLLAAWHIKPTSALIVDPFSRAFGMDAAISLLVTFSKENVITKDFQTECRFPLSRPLEIIPGAPAGMTVQWLAQTTPKAWGVTDLKSLSGGPISFKEGKDKVGPLTAAIAVSGKQKDSKASKNTRIVAFGTSLFATNNFSRYGGNMDFFLNAVSWVMEDENLISIRTKEEGPGKVEMSEKTATFIFLLTVIVMPLLIAAGGVVIWAIRRRL